MRSYPGSFHLSFLLSKGFDLSAGDAPFLPAEICKVRVTPPLVKVAGPSREAVFECAARLIRAARYGRAPCSFAGMLVTPGPVPHTDSWSIIVGADVAFSPTSLDPHLPMVAAQ